MRTASVRFPKSPSGLGRVKDPRTRGNRQRYLPRTEAPTRERDRERAGGRESDSSIEATKEKKTVPHRPLSPCPWQRRPACGSRRSFPWKRRARARRRPRPRKTQRSPDRGRSDAENRGATPTQDGPTEQRPGEARASSGPSSGPSSPSWAPLRRGRDQTRLPPPLRTQSSPTNPRFTPPHRASPTRPSTRERGSRARCAASLDRASRARR